MALRFDRGTLVVDGAGVEPVPAVVWDDRVQAWRAPAYRYLATGSGKTIVAAAALAGVGRRSVVLCPTRALLEQWERQLQRYYRGTIGTVGDGTRRIEDVTVMTFESAYRQLDTLGGRFGALVVDEAHHFGGGLRAEALEMYVPSPLSPRVDSHCAYAGQRRQSLARGAHRPHRHEVSVGGDGRRVRIGLSGPLSILRDTTKYGHALAAYVPAAEATPGWVLEARCHMGGRLARIRAGAADHIASTHALLRDCDSAVESVTWH